METANLLIRITNKSIYGIPFDGTFSNERDIYVRRADSLVLSFVECDTLHEGVDGMVPAPQSVWGRNYDARTGKVLTLSDVFTDASKLAAAVEERLRSDYPICLLPFPTNTHVEVQSAFHL